MNHDTILETPRPFAHLSADAHRLLDAAKAEAQKWRDFCCEPGGVINFGRERFGAEAVERAVIAAAKACASTR